MIIINCMWFVIVCLFVCFAADAAFYIAICYLLPPLNACTRCVCMNDFVFFLQDSFLDMVGVVKVMLFALFCVCDSLF